MKILIKNALIADPSSSFNGQFQDILIANEKIIAIEPLIQQQADHIINIDNLIVSQGWVDVFCQFNDPGAEHKETLETGAMAAAAGGFTDVFVVPNTNPALHNRSQIEYIRKKSQGLPANIYPLGAVSKNCEGRELAEMYEMKSGGAIAFSDGWRPIQSPQLMLKALQYVKTFNGVVLQLPQELSIGKNGLINEGIVSTQLGLPGKPAIAESLMIARDIELLRYTQSRLHITGVSTKAGIDLIRQAKNEGLEITCSVTPYHLFFTDNDLNQYDTNLKVNPPLRTHDDVEALRIAILDGSIDCISSHHYPHEWDGKTCEFEYAKYGMEGLESCFGAVMKATPGLNVNKITALFADNSRKIFGLPSNPIQIGGETNITLFSNKGEYIFEMNSIKSLGKNNAFIGKILGGKVIGTIRKDYFNFYM